VLVALLIPYHFLLVDQYETAILVMVTVLFVNLTGGLFTFGRRLAHFDRELNAGHTPMPPHLHREELT
jgi:hypothetical protein